MSSDDRTGDGDTERDSSVATGGRDEHEAGDDEAVSDHALTALADAAPEFRRADDTEAVAGVAVELACDVVGGEVACVHQYDPETSSLHRTAETESATTLAAELVGFDFGQTDAGRALRTGEVTHDGRAGTCLSSERLSGTGVHVPLGDHGVLTVVLDETRPDGAVLSALERVATVVTTEFERVAEWSERTAALSASNETRDRLATVRTVQSRLDEATAAGLGADTPRGATAAVTRTLARSDSVQSARAVEPAASGLETVAVADDDGVVVEHVATGELSVVGTEFVTAFIDGDPTAGDGHVVFDAPDPAVYALGETADAAVARNAVGVPLGGAEITDALLLLTPAEEQLLVADTLDVVGSFARVLGHVLAAKRMEELVTSDRVVRVEFEVTDTSCLAVGVSAALETDCSVERVVQNNDGSVLSYLEVATGDEETAVQATAALPETEAVSVVESSAQTTYLEVTRESSAANDLIAAGGSAEVATASDGVGTLVIDAPLSANLSALIDQYTERTDATLVSKQTAAPSPSSTDTDEIGLTDRQREVLVAAHAAGYYAWPRERTAEQVAESLGISVSTFSEHLRTAHRRLVGAFLD